MVASRQDSNAEVTSTEVTSTESPLRTHSAILSSFRECGLVPFQPGIVLAKVREFEAPRDPRRLSTPPPDLPGFTPEPITPMTDRALQRHADALEIATPSRKGVLEEQFKKGALIMAKCSAQLRATLAENTAAERERKARKAQPKRQLHAGGYNLPV